MSIYLGNKKVSGVSVQPYQGLMPVIEVVSQSTVYIAPNILTYLSPLTEAIDISLEKGLEGYDNEWCFILTQGQTAYDVALPIVEWTLGIAPTFLPNSTTEVRLHYKGERLEGVWN